MAIKINNKDFTTVWCPAVNGVRSEAQAIRIYNGSAWVDAWTNIKIMTVLSNSITGGFSDLTTDKRRLALYQYQKGIAGGGTVIVYLDGEWTNPIITFDWTGGTTYSLSGTLYSVPAGSISLYHRVKGASSAGTTQVVSSVGDVTTGSNGTKSGSYSGTLTGTYDRIGLSIYLSSYAGAFDNPFMQLVVNNFNIGVQKVGFPDALKYDYD